MDVESFDSLIGNCLVLAGPDLQRTQGLVTPS
jgi:hypothetical protein